MNSSHKGRRVEQDCKPFLKVREILARNGRVPQRWQPLESNDVSGQLETVCARDAMIARRRRPQRRSYPDGGPPRFLPAVRASSDGLGDARKLERDRDQEEDAREHQRPDQREEPRVADEADDGLASQPVRVVNDVGDSKTREDILPGTDYGCPGASDAREQPLSFGDGEQLFRRLDAKQSVEIELA